MGGEGGSSTLDPEFQLQNSGSGIYMLKQQWDTAAKALKALKH